MLRQLSRQSSEVLEVIETKATDQFPTDAWLLAVFDGWFDPCPLNAAPEVDGLSIEWPDRTYVNPPYSNPTPWVEKAIQEYRGGKRIVMLLKDDHTTQWRKALRQAGAHFLDINERMHHGGKYASPFPSVLVFLTPESGEGKQ